MNKCPTCQSPKPHLHPAVQFEGEVHTCIDDFHLAPTNQNTSQYIAMVHEARQRRQRVSHSTGVNSSHGR